jgi:TolB-like protein
MSYSNQDTQLKVRAVKSIQGACQFIAALTLLLSLGACSKRYSDLPAFSAVPLRDYENHSVGRFKSAYLASQLDQYYRGVNPGPIGVTTFVDLDNLYTTSSFGRIYAEQIMSELSMRGYDVVELRHSDALQFLMNNGEFALSRDVATLQRARDLGAIIVGTYVASPERVYVNARLVDPSSSRVLSAGSVEMNKTNEITRLVRAGTVAPSLERIPVRHLGMSQFPMRNNLHQMWMMEEMGNAQMMAPSPSPDSNSGPKLFELEESPPEMTK